MWFGGTPQQQRPQGGVARPWAPMQTTSVRGLQLPVGVQLPGSGGVQLQQQFRPAGVQPSGLVANVDMAQMMQKAAERRKEEEAKRAKMGACLKVRKVIQRLRMASMETMDEIRQELEQRIAEEMENMGDDAQKVIDEAEKAVNEAQEKFDKRQQEILAAEAKEREEEQKRLEEAEKASVTLQEVAVLIEGLESRVLDASNAKKSLEEVDTDANNIEELAELTTSTIEAALSSSDEVSNIMKEKRWAMKETDAGRKLLNDFDKLYYQLATSCETLENLKASVEKSKEKALRIVGWGRRARAKRQRFDKFDSDKDGKLSLEDVVRLANDLYGYRTEGAQLQQMFASLCAGEAQGLPFEKFDRLCAAVSIAKSVEKAEVEAVEAARMQAIKDEEARQKDERNQSQRETIKEKLEMAAKTRREADSPLADIRNILKKTGNDRGLKFLSSSELEERIAELQDKLAQVQEVLARASSQETEADSVARKEFGLMDKPLQNQLSSFRSAMADAENVLTKARKSLDVMRRASRDKQCAESESKRLEISKGIRMLMDKEQQSPKEMFDEACGADAEGVSKSGFLSFLQKLGGSLDPEARPDLLHPDALTEAEVDPIFAYITDGGDVISEDAFLRLGLLFYHAVKATVITKSISVNSEHVKRLEMGEIVESMSCPQVDSGSGVKRLQCRRLQNDGEGFITLSGNKGSIFLEALPHLFTCAKEADLTTDGKTVRKIASGEVLHLLELEASEEAGRLKARVRCRQDGSIGWINLKGAGGSETWRPYKPSA